MLAMRMALAMVVLLPAGLLARTRLHSQMLLLWLLLRRSLGTFCRRQLVVLPATVVDAPLGLVRHVMKETA
jgi:hypothetical protein